MRSPIYLPECVGGIESLSCGFPPEPGETTVNWLEIDSVPISSINAFDRISPSIEEDIGNPPTGTLQPADPIPNPPTGTLQPADPIPNPPTGTLQPFDPGVPPVTGELSRDTSRPIDVSLQIAGGGGVESTLVPTQVLIFSGAGSNVNA